MKKLFKYLLILLIAIVLLIGAAVVIVPMVVDPKDYVSIAASQVKSHTGRDLKVEGEVDLSVFPWLGLRADGVSLSNPAGFSVPVFARTESLEVRIKLMPLLQRKVEMDTVVVHGLQLNLERLQDGRTNWDDLAGKPADSSATPAPSGSEQPPPIAALAIGGLDVRDATIAFKDAQAGQSVALDKLDFSTGAVALGEPVDFNLGFDLDLAKPKLTGRVQANATIDAKLESKSANLSAITFDADLKGGSDLPFDALKAKLVGDAMLDGIKQTLSIAGLRFDADMEGGDGAPFGSLSLALNGNLAGDLQGQKLSSDDLQASVKGTGRGGMPLEKFDLSVSGKLAADGRAQSASLGNMKLTLDGSGSGEAPFQSLKATLVGNLAADGSSQSVRVKGLNLDADMTGPKLPNGKAKAQLTGDLEFDGAKQSASVSDFKLNALGLDVTGWLAGEDLAKGGKLSGKLNVAEFNPKAFLKLLGQQLPATADPNALTKVALSAGLSGDLNSIYLKPLNASVDQTKISGELGLANITRMALRFNLGVDQLNADRYLPPTPASAGGQAAGQSAGGGQAAAGTPGAAATKTAEVPVEQLRALDIDGRLKIGSLQISNMKSRQVSAVIKAKDGLIRLSPLAAALYQGNYSGDITIDARQDVPRIALNEKITGIQADSLLTDLNGDSKLSGTGDLAAKLTASGASAEAMKRTLSGDASFVFRNGAVKGFNIGRSIREARARLSGQALPPSNEPLQTDFAELSGSMNFVDGLGTNKDLLAKSPLLRVTGQGTANLVSEQINYKATAKIVGSLKGQGGKETTDLKGVPIPMKIGGTFSNPSYGLDFEALAAALATSKGKALVQEQLKGKVGGEAGKLLDQVLGGDSSGASAQSGAKPGGSVLDKIPGGKKDKTGGAGDALKKLFGN